MRGWNPLDDLRLFRETAALGVNGGGGDSNGTGDGGSENDDIDNALSDRT
jgi:hypothetical protein